MIRDRGDFVSGTRGILIGGIVDVDPFVVIVLVNLYNMISMPISMVCVILSTMRLHLTAHHNEFEDKITLQRGGVTTTRLLRIILFAN